MNEREVHTSRDVFTVDVSQIAASALNASLDRLDSFGARLIRRIGPTRYVIVRKPKEETHGNAGTQANSRPLARQTR